MHTTIIKTNNKKHTCIVILLIAFLSAFFCAWAKAEPKYTSIWQTITYEFKLDHKAETPQVQREIRVLLAEKEKLHHILNAAAPYIYYIHQTTKHRGLPAELTLLPFIESEFNPNDRSSTGATGLWQLMHGTARDLGVKMYGGYDGRRNIVESTNAALAHLKYLGGNFKGNWYFAIAAYNCGQGRIESSKRHYGTQTVWFYPIPIETKRYVARIMALAHILKHPKQYGIKLPPIENTPFFAEVSVKKNITLAKIAQSAKINLQLLRKLNPDCRSGNLFKRNGSYHFLVPIENALTFKA